MAKSNKNPSSWMHEKIAEFEANESLSHDDQMRLEQYRSLVELEKAGVKPNT